MKFCRRISRSFRIAQIQLFCGLSKPLFLFCFLTALLPGLLLVGVIVGIVIYLCVQADKKVSVKK